MYSRFPKHSRCAIFSGIRHCQCSFDVPAMSWRSLGEASATFSRICSSVIQLKHSWCMGVNNMSIKLLGYIGKTLPRSTCDKISRMQLEFLEYKHKLFTRLSRCLFTSPMLFRMLSRCFPDVNVNIGVPHECIVDVSGSNAWFGIFRNELLLTRYFLGFLLSFWLVEQHLLV